MKALGSTEYFEGFFAAYYGKGFDDSMRGNAKYEEGYGDGYSTSESESALCKTSLKHCLPKRVQEIRA